MNEEEKQVLVAFGSIAVGYIGIAAITTHIAFKIGPKWGLAAISLFVFLVLMLPTRIVNKIRKQDKEDQ